MPRTNVTTDLDETILDQMEHAIECENSTFENVKQTLSDLFKVAKLIAERNGDTFSADIRYITSDIVLAPEDKEGTPQRIPAVGFLLQDHNGQKITGHILVGSGKNDVYGDTPIYISIKTGELENIFEVDGYATSNVASQLQRAYNIAALAASTIK